MRNEEPKDKVKKERIPGMPLFPKWTLSKKGRTFRKNMTFFLFMLPALIGLILFYIKPFGTVVQFSFVDNAYAKTIKLNKDMTFEYGLYGDLEDNHFSGTYTYEDEHKKNNSGEYSYYMVSFDTEEGVVEGKKQTIDTSNSLSDMEIGIAEGDDGKEAITIFTSSGNMYYCYDYSEDKD